jgi:hypothetical protein
MKNKNQQDENIYELTQVTAYLSNELTTASYTRTNTISSYIHICPVLVDRKWKFLPPFPDMTQTLNSRILFW